MGTPSVPKVVKSTQAIIRTVGLLPAQAGPRAADILAVTAALPGDNMQLIDAAKRLCDNFAQPVFGYTLFGNFVRTLARAYPDCEEAAVMRREVLSL